MTTNKKPQRRSTTTTTAITGTPAAPDRAPETAPAATPAVDRLSILRNYADEHGFLPVLVAVAHDNVFMGQHLRVPVTDRVAGLIEIGFLEVESLEPWAWL